ncbi:immunity protein Imm33 domain-containing protein [Embleya hyalina]|uniref:Imm33-like domain-containing protein n=1 Tax=Embleya hyalina TaxID=516124 RepID=A0A401YNE3_9ACTN|nr:hypothetical protein [Embleya hyalina]GCD96029.1 hypothetical protein EHYA_03713 [Embleya hyalina]
MDPERRARVEAAARTARAELGASPDPEDLQRYLFGSGVHGADAVLVTMQVLEVGLREANAAFFGSPLRKAERDFQNSFVDTLDLVAETDRKQRQLCSEHQVPWSPPVLGSIVGVARDVGAGGWPINGLRHPIEGTTCGWYLWAGEGEMDQDPDYFQPVHVDHLFDRCPRVLPYLGLPPGWRFLIAPGHSDVWHDPELLTIDHHRPPE